MRERAMRASAWTIGGLIGQQGIRFVSNLILTRLLFPEAFGLMAIINVWLFGFQMISDVGIGQTVIQNRRGDDPDFLNTVWTVQILRGLALWLIACGFAWPLAALYDQPDLLALLPATGLAALIGGFTSTNLKRLNRHLKLGRLTLLNVGSQLFGVCVMIGWAWWRPSVWALVIGAIAGAGARSLLSHIAVPGPGNRAHWEREAARELISFGKWILFSSATNFFSRQGDRLLMAALVPLETLGVYAIAFFLADAPSRLVSSLQHQVLFPVLSQLVREQRERLGEVYYRARLRIELLVIGPAVLLIAAGNDLVTLLYDPRYEEAGWMLQILAIRILFGVIGGPGSLCLLSLGRSNFLFWPTLAQAIWLFSLMPLALSLYGLHGMIWAIGLHGVPGVVIVLWGLSRAGVLSLKQELASVLRMTGAMGAGMLVWSYSREWVLDGLAGLWALVQSGLGAGGN